MQDIAATHSARKCNADDSNQEDERGDCPPLSARADKGDLNIAAGRSCQFLRNAIHHSCDAPAPPDGRREDKHFRRAADLAARTFFDKGL